MNPEEILGLTAGVVLLFAGLLWLASSLTRPRPPKEFTGVSHDLYNGVL